MKTFSLILVMTFFTASSSGAAGDCEGKWIGDVSEPGNTFLVELRHFEAAENHGRELTYATRVRVDEPFNIELHFVAEEIPCERGWIEVEVVTGSSRGTPKRISVRRIEAPEGTSRFRSEELTLGYEAGTGTNAIRLPRSDQPQQLAVTATKTHPAQSFAVVPPLPEGSAVLSVVVREWDGGPPGEYSELNRGRLTLSGPEGFRFTRSGDGFFRDVVEAGVYSIDFEILGVHVRAPDVVVEAGIERDVELGGPEHFGVVGWSDEDAGFFERIFGSEKRPTCSYARNGVVVFESDCVYDQLPKGNFTLTIAPTLFPKPFGLRVPPGERRERAPEIGVLSLHDRVSRGGGSRNLSLSVRSADGSSKSFTLDRDVKHMLPVGEYVLEARDDANDGELKRLVEIKPAMATIIELDEVRSKPPPETAAASSPLTVWDGDDWGETKIYERRQANGIIATYSEDEGRIYGSLKGRQLVGVWVEDDAARKCAKASATPAPRMYWGKVVLHFNEDFTKFRGEWGYCDEALDLTWVGTRRAGDGGAFRQDPEARWEITATERIEAGQDDENAPVDGDDN